MDSVKVSGKSKLRKVYEKIITPESTMAKRLRLEELVPDSDEESGDDQDGVGNMQSNIWSSKSKPAQVKKRRRTQARGDTKPMSPSDIPFGRFKEILVCMAYAGTNPKFNFFDWINKTSSSEEIGILGIKLSIIAPIMECICGPGNRLNKTMTDLAKIGHSGWASTQFLIHMHEFIITHHVTYSTQIEEHGMQCAINNKPPKGSNHLVLFELKRHEVRRGKGRDEETAKMAYFEPYIQDSKFVVSTQYDKILFGFWWLINLEYLVAHNCKKWIDLVRKIPPEERRTLFPEFASGSDTLLAQLYINTNEEACHEMYLKMIEYTTLIEKYNTMMQKRKPELIKKAKELQEKNL